nr:site-specific integrase [uncultured Desulfobacter sp.]
MRLTSCLHQYFYEYLPSIKGTSKQSVQAYRQSLSLFLHFLANHHSIKIKSLKIEHLTVDAVLAFLQHLEKNRKNSVQTRNQRLAVIKSLAKMIRFMHPDKKRIAEALLNIPQKRAQKKVMGFLYPEEIMKVFSAVDLKKKEGMRDFTILHLLYDSGARANEIATLEFDYFDPENETIAVLGKGNRYRLINPKTSVK